MRIALLDNDKSQCKLVTDILQTAGHTCRAFEHANELYSHAQHEAFDMLILHLDETQTNDPAVLRWAREHMAAGVPLFFITHSSAEDEIIAALAAGADDYIIKPLRRGEMSTRVQALLRRAYPNMNEEGRIDYGCYTFDSRSNRLTMHGNAIEITQKEFDLALLFFRNLGRPLSRAFILESVWERDVEVNSRTMDTHVSRIRSKLCLRPEHGYRLTPVYSYGYRLEKTTD